jgi:four helix bundle protein
VIGNKLVGYQKLIAWQVADELAWEVYELTDKFPKHELYGMTSQLRRAVLSVPLNIVEGHARNNKNEFRRFLKIALGSLAEVDYLLKFSIKRKYITYKDCKEVAMKRESCGKLLWKLMKSQS